MQPEIVLQENQCLRGIELEGWAEGYTRGHLCNVEPVIERLKKRSYKHGTFTTEPGFGSFELVGKEACTVDKAVQNISELHALLRNQGVRTLYCNKRPSGTVPPNSELPTSRYKALWEATRREARACGYTDHQWSRLHWMKERAALQVTFSVAGLEINASKFSPELIFAMNMLTFVGPRIAKLQLEGCGVANSDHASIWHGWASPNRFTYQTLWHKDFDQIRRHFESLPRLLKCTRHDPRGSKRYGDWDVDLVTPHEWGCLDDEQTGWWPYIRPRIKFEPGALEVRLHPAIPLEHVCEAVKELDAFFRYLISVAPKQALDYTDLKASEQWKLITRYPFSGQYVPANYSQEMRRRDIDGIPSVEAAA